MLNEKMMAALVEFQDNNKFTRATVTGLGATLISCLAETADGPNEHQILSDVADKLASISAQFEKKSGSGSKLPTKRQKENEDYKRNILALLETSDPMRAGEVGTVIGISQNRASALLKQLVDAGMAQRKFEKKVSRFSLA